MSVREITKGQIITIHTLLRQRGLSDDKPRIITEASGGRSSSCAQLYYDEAQRLINFLQGKSEVGSRKSEEELKKEKMVKKIFAMAHEIGMISRESVVESSAPGKIVEKNNYSRLHGWVEKFGYLHKHLNDYKYTELPKLLSQFEFGPYKDYLKKL